MHIVGNENNNFFSVYAVLISGTHFPLSGSRKAVCDSRDPQNYSIYQDKLSNDVEEILITRRITQFRLIGNFGIFIQK